MQVPRNRRARWVLALPVLLSLTACAQEADTASRQEQVARRGAEVMPFDLDQTTHVFQPRPDGGVQTVVADEPVQQRQVLLIRRHLQKEARAFSRGDFGDPAQIHGGDMPGLRELKTGYDEVTIRFTKTPTGARLRYRTDDPRVVDALHSWFEAQLMDHGGDATHGG